MKLHIQNPKQPGRQAFILAAFLFTLLLVQTGSAADPEALGDELARRLKAQGASEILASLTP